MVIFIPMTKFVTGSMMKSNKKDFQVIFKTFNQHWPIRLGLD